ncbi:MAG: hypothetical protein JXX14_18410 [Deltaproteobacteria bacterium]|nr:hypothetical protein [Deltaproteobacteria bacterium]
MIDLSFASSHLEGNTYSLLDTVRLLQEGIIARYRIRPSEFKKWRQAILNDG